jgi:hypothetical protein
VIAALAGCIALMPTIKDQRADLRPNVDAAGLPPEYALINTALGPFRGLFVDWLWYRTEMLKRQNKIYEVNTNARWITTLQPRFPMVWSFHSWNLAYNISVKTDTPEERWGWVQKGIRLLREEGIPANPRTLRLYRDLSNTFLHKVGQRSDDVHFYYREQLAARWQQVLGEATLADTEQQALSRFEPIATMAERYVMRDEPPRAMRQKLDELAVAHPDYADRLREVKHWNLARGERRLNEWISAWRGGAPELVSALKPLHQELRTLASGNPIGRFKQAHPQAGRILDALRQAGLTLDEKGLLTLGAVLMKRHFARPGQLEGNLDQHLTEAERAFWPVIEKHAASDGWQTALAFVRARVLWEAFNMDPAFMYEQIEKFGPLDWRHPASHALYWAARGVAVAQTVRYGGDLDMLNTDRKVIHAAQMLFHNGRLYYHLTSFKPLEGNVRLLPDPRFIEAYQTALNDAERRLRQRHGDEAGYQDSFETGHENLLKDAVVYEYLYGNQRDAAQHLQALRQQYGQRADGSTKQLYQLSVEQYVSRLMQEDLGTDQDTTRNFVDGMVRQAVLNGLANGRMNVFNRFMRSAQRVHRAYHEKRSAADKAPIAEQHRLALPPFPQIVVDVYVGLMGQSDRLSLDMRRRIYGNSPTQLQRMVYQPLARTLRGELAQRGVSMAEAFPPPSGVGSSQESATDGGASP